jgi:hypothetical protein
MSMSLNRPLTHVVCAGQLFAFDIIGEVTFSNSFGFMEAGNDDGSFNQIETALKSAAWM